MTDLSLPATGSSPQVQTRAVEGILEMRGDSYPENSFDFFSPIFAWVQCFLAEAGAPLKLELHLLYLNTSSVKAMMDIFDLLEDGHDHGKPVEVNWYYDTANDRIAELAEEFKEDCTFPFHIIKRGA